jgi:2-succinyl-6-hydroxy-2,4-cyclohexadiene-1-carboxylate synthase
VTEAVTLLHGFTLTGESWSELVRKMPAGRRWITPDLRGHGSARIAPCTMDDCAADLVALWDHLGVERSHVVGYSMGGRLALHVAVRLPERTLSLLTIGAHAGLEAEAREARRQADDVLAERLEREGIESFVAEWEALPMFAGVSRRGPEFTAWLHGLRIKSQAAGLAASLRDMGAGAMEPLWDKVDAIDVPCTFVAGERDDRFVQAARRLADSVPDSRIKIVPDAGHAAHFEEPDATAQILDYHLRRAAAGSTGTAASSSTTD